MKIMAIDPSIESLQFLANNLEPYGYELQGALNIKLAFNVARTGFHADLVMVNLSLCRAQRFAELELLREMNPHMMMVAISDTDSEAAGMQAYALGFRGFISKPFEISKILTEFERMSHTSIPIGLHCSMNPRREPRFHIALPLILEVADELNRHAFLEHTLTADISCAGVCVRTGFNVPLGKQVTIIVPEMRGRYNAIVRGSHINNECIRYLNLEVIDSSWEQFVKQQAGLTDLTYNQLGLPVAEMEQTRTRVLNERYELQRLIGQGGLGAVYQAFDLVNKEMVAVKLLVNLGENDNERSYSRLLFQRECEMLVQINHPNIVGIVDNGVSAAGEPYLVMRYIEGTPLDELIRQEGVWSITRVLDLLKQICPALQVMHEKRLIHRDLKPGNIIINRSGDREIATLVDLGLAKRVRIHGEELNINSLTQTGMIVGTLPYISPEQCMGKTVDTRTDIYSLGILLYELLTGHVPFEATSVGGWLLAHVKHEPIPLRETNPNISQAVEQVILWALEKEPEDRPANMMLLLENFEVAARYFEDSHRFEEAEIINKTSTGELRKTAPTLVFSAEACG